MQKGIWMSVFRNKKHEENPKAPIMNVLINFPDGTVLEGGLWEKTSSKGTVYLNGQLRSGKDRQQNGYAAPVEAADPSTKAVKVDW
jgi:hypothetical protein